MKRAKDTAMTSPCRTSCIMTLAGCTASSAFLLSTAGAALAAQGPGVIQGTAGNLTQLAMAILVYGASALVVGTGLIGALRRH